MQPAWLVSLTDWISAHPVAAGGVAFLIAFCDALALVGVVVPALPLLFAVGVLIGMGHINGPYALACAALGAFAGDGLSFWFGRHFGPRLRELWLFRRYPDLLTRAERMFKRHDIKSIFIARFVGAVRPFVPAIAGMMHMQYRRFAIPSFIASALWAGLFLAPGWIFGTSYEAVSAVADRLAIVLLGVVAVIAAVWAVVVYVSRLFADHADAVFARMLAWSRTHPRLGSYVEMVVDPNRPERPSRLVLLAALIALGWILAAWAWALINEGGPLLLDVWTYELMFALRNPLADQFMAALASLGDTQVLLPAFVAGLAWLAWRRRWMAAVHWLAAVAFGFLMSEALKFAVHMPRPPTAPAGFGFPSVSVMMTMTVLGFFAVLIARELPGRRRVWPYLVAGVVSALVGFARLYLGAHWLSDIVIGLLFGMVWLLLIGVAYRRHVQRSFWMRPLAMTFFAVFLAAAAWHAPKRSGELLAKFTPPMDSSWVLSRANWWTQEWEGMRSSRNELDNTDRWPLDVQIAGPLAPMMQRLAEDGWHVQPQADWLDALRVFDDKVAPQQQKVLPATMEARPEYLLFVRDLQDGRRDVLRIWQSPAALDDGTPFWVGTAQRMVFERRARGLISLWRPGTNQSRAHEDVARALQGLKIAESAHPESGQPVLRVDTTAAAIPGTSPPR